MKRLVSLKHLGLKREKKVRNNDGEKDSPPLENKDTDRQ